MSASDTCNARAFCECCYCEKKPGHKGKHRVRDTRWNDADRMVHDRIAWETTAGVVRRCETQLATLHYRLKKVLETRPDLVEDVDALQAMIRATAALRDDTIASYAKYNQQGDYDHVPKEWKEMQEKYPHAAGRDYFAGSAIKGVIRSQIGVWRWEPA